MSPLGEAEQWVHGSSLHYFATYRELIIIPKKFLNDLKDMRFHIDEIEEMLVGKVSFLLGLVGSRRDYAII